MRLKNKKRLVLGVTTPGSSRLLDGQVAFFIAKGYDVYLLSPNHIKEREFCEREGCTHLPISIARDIAPIRDVFTLIKIIFLLKKLKPDIVNVGTAKIGLLGILACKILGIKNRIYTCRGFRFETLDGLKKSLIINIDYIIVMFSKKIIYVSKSLKETARRFNLLDESKTLIIGKGSSNGIDLNYFNKENINFNKRQNILDEYKLTGKVVFGYMGRISSDKGVDNLVAAFEELFNSNNNVLLFLVGHKDCKKELENRINEHPGIIYFPFQDDVPLFMSLFNIFVLPSLREGFPNVAIQAAAMELPVITTNATGCRDAVKHNYNGLIYERGASEELADAMRYYLQNPGKIALHGQNGLKWAAHFKNLIIWDGLHSIYQSLLYEN